MLLFGLACTLLSVAMYQVNARVDSGCGNENGYFEITNLEERTSESVMLGRGWIFVPNVDYVDIDNGSFSYADYESLPHADNVSISTRQGWRNLGDDASWHNCETCPDFNVIERDGKHKITGLYMATLHFERTDTTYHLNVPQANGLVVVYCNGSKLGTMWNRVDEWTPSFGFGYGHVPIIPDENGNAQIILAVSASDSLYNPGIVGMPSIADAGQSYKFVVIPSLWYAVQVTLFFFLLVGGLLIARTHKNKANIFIVLAIELLVLIFTFIDCHFVTQTTVIREISKYITMIAISVLVYLFIYGIYNNSSKDKRHLISKIVSAIIVATGIIYILVAIFNPSVLGTRFPHISGTTFTTLISVISACLIYKLSDQDDSKPFAGMALTSFILFTFYMFSVPGGIYNVPIYTFFFIITNLVVEIFYIVRYVSQARELEETNRRMQYLVKEKTQHISEINRDLFNTNKRLMENEEARKNVLSNVSHDLRTPITAIRGYTELLISNGERMKPEQQKTYLNNIIRRATQMEQIISDIVELTRLESNANEFQFTDVSMSELLEEICMMYEPDLEHTKKKLKLSLPENDLLIVRADPKKISRVIENLVSNAINYTKEEANILVKAWRDGDLSDISSQTVNIDVIDDGIGIPENEIRNVFDRFYRAKNSGQNIKGTGIGLSIVKTIVDHHDAQITVESELGKGTTFHLTMKATYN